MNNKITAQVSHGEFREWGLFVLLVGPNFFLFSVFTFWPLLYNIYLSLHQWDMLSPVKIWVGLDNYVALFTSADFGQIVGNTFLFTIVSVALTILFGLGGALLLNQPLKGRDGIRAVLFSPTVLSGAAIGIVWIYIFDPRFGLIQSFLSLLGVPSPNWLTDPAWAMPAVIIVYVWKHLGYSMVIILAGLKILSKEIYEAARVDGAGAWARFWNITLPGLSPVMFFLLLTNTLNSFQAFDIIKIMTNGGPVNATNTLVYYLYEQGFIAFNAGKAGVTATVLFVIMLTFTIIQMRYTERGVHYA
jgi:multiple sugar transport system permease protein/sn-glycerol 3-phosphate transport system permease protein